MAAGLYFRFSTRAGGSEDAKQTCDSGYRRGHDGNGPGRGRVIRSGRAGLGMGDDAADEVATPDATDPDMTEGDQGGRPDSGGGDAAEATPGAIRATSMTRSTTEPKRHK